MSSCKYNLIGILFAFFLVARLKGDKKRGEKEEGGVDYSVVVISEDVNVGIVLGQGGTECLLDVICFQLK